MRLGVRVDLPPLDYLGVWPPGIARLYTASHRNRLDPLIGTDDEAVPYYCGMARQAWLEAEEQRARRQEIEQEMALEQQRFRERPAPEIRYIERKVYTPMPPQEVVRRITIERGEPMHPSIVVTPAEQQRELGLCARIGDRLDRVFRSKRTKPAALLFRREPR